MKTTMNMTQRVRKCVNNLIAWLSDEDTKAYNVSQFNQMYVNYNPYFLMH